MKIGVRPYHLFSASMLDRTDIEAVASRDASDEAETEALLPNSQPVEDSLPQAKACFARSCSRNTFGIFHITAAFVLGAVVSVVTQYALCGTNCFRFNASADSAAHRPLQHNEVTVLAPPYVGSTEVHNFPPSKPTNAFPSLFPTDVGYAGSTPTGAEPAVIATAPSYPIHPAHCSQQLVAPDTITGQKLNYDGSDDEDATKKHRKFDLFKSWGNLTPWYSVKRNAFGINSTPEAPDTCVVTGLHFLHRHGARYPTADAAPSKFSRKLNKSPETWNASGDLDFLNSWFVGLSYLRPHHLFHS